MTINLGEWLKLAKKLLKERTDTPALEAELLAAHLIKRPRTWILTHPEFKPSEELIRSLNQLLEHRASGTPLPYLLESWQFYGLEFTVSPAVLIPRPETEELVDKVLLWCRQKNTPIATCDLGTGSGCIAISLAHNNPNLQIDAVDISPAALEIARGNIVQHNLQTRINTVLSDLLTSLNKKYDLVVANLPYIPTSKLSELEVSRFEPHLALDGGEDGLMLIRKTIIQGKERMNMGGLMAFEIESTIGQAALAAAHQLWPECRSELSKDLRGADRFLFLYV